jgi:hypothetical protein
MNEPIIPVAVTDNANAASDPREPSLQAGIFIVEDPEPI